MAGENKMLLEKYTPYDPFNFFDVDFDKLIPERLLSLDAKVNRYPLTNLGRDEQGNLIIEIACAGFGLDDLSIQTEDNMIIVKGHKEESEKNIKYIQEHISAKEFVRKVYMIPLYVGGNVSAMLKDGILTITVSPVEEKKPKEIAIKNGDTNVLENKLKDENAENAVSAE